MPPRGAVMPAGSVCGSIRSSSVTSAVPFIRRGWEWLLQRDLTVEILPYSDTCHYIDANGTISVPSLWVGPYQSHDQRPSSRSPRKVALRSSLRIRELRDQEKGDLQLLGQAHVATICGSSVSSTSLTPSVPSLASRWATRKD